MSMIDRVAPYVEQLLEDDDVQANLQRSVTRARQAYAAITANKNAKKAAKDRRVRLRLMQSVAAARDAAIALRQGPEKQRRRRRRARLLVVAVIAGGALVTLNESVRVEIARRLREITQSSPGPQTDTDPGPVTEAGHATGPAAAPASPPIDQH